MSRQPTNATTAGRVYLALRKKAREEGRSTDELLQLHALEAFVDRLSTSDRAGDFVLKGGVLLSAYDIRRPTRDVDLSTQSLPNALPILESVIAEIATLARDDGWALEADGAEVIREDAAYSGVRIAVRGSLASARQEFHVDVSFGDPITPTPIPVALERLLGGQISVIGYPLPMVFAEKLVTALHRGTTNTRWRDYADVFLLSRAHRIQGKLLAESLRLVATARGVTLHALSIATEGFASLAQSKWAAWVRKQQFTDRLPLHFGMLLGAVVAFADPVLVGSTAERSWDPNSLRWM